MTSGKKLDPIVPELEFIGKNVLAYKLFHGKTLYDIDDHIIYNNFLYWLKERLWSEQGSAQKEKVEASCWEFYHNKTIDRMNWFLSERDDSYEGCHTVTYKNETLSTRPIKHYIDEVDWNSLITSESCRIHGDLQFDNALYCEASQSFRLIDWREDFAGLYAEGDIYYDLAKLYGGMIMNYGLVRDCNTYEITQSGENIKYNWHTDGNWHKFIDSFKVWVIFNKYDINKIELLTALIFLNMSPLHCDGLDDILFYHSKFMLEKITKS